MKKLLSVCLLLAMLFTSCACAHAGSGWYCPSCGRYNEDNFCPKDGTARPDDLPPSSGSSGSGTYFSSVYATLNQKLATRTGPGTKYDEPGSFLKAGCSVKVLSKAFDISNGIWWVQVEFTSNGKNYCAYTGAKRFDNLNLDLIPAEEIIGSCSISDSSIEAFYGPSYDYAPIKRKIPSGVQCDIYAYVQSSSPDGSDFIQIEFYDSSMNCRRRAWVAEWWVDNYTLYNGF